MKKVEFVRVESQLSGYGYLKGIKSSFEPAEDVIEEYLLNGWDYLGYIPVETRATVEEQIISLIFSKEDN